MKTKPIKTIKTNAGGRARIRREKQKDGSYRNYYLSKYDEDGDASKRPVKHYI